MITESARTALDRIFTDAVRANLPLDSADRIELAALGKDADAANFDGEMMVVTSSSFLFRLLTVFQVGRDAQSVQYFGRGRSDAPIAEAFAEIANLCCGAMNRDFARYFPHLGMSTPYVLHGNCVDYLGDLKPQHVSRYEVAINDGVRIGATLCLCAPEALEFVPLETSEACVESGALEIF